MQEIINKLLGMDIHTRRRTVEAVVLYIFTAAATFNLPILNDAQQDVVVKVVICAVEAFILFYEAHYKNNDHTTIAAEHTGEMRQEKAEQSDTYVGERFYTEEPEEVDVDGEFDVLVDEDEPYEGVEEDVPGEEIVEEGEGNE